MNRLNADRRDLPLAHAHRRSLHAPHRHRQHPHRATPRGARLAARPRGGRRARCAREGAAHAAARPRGSPAAALIAMAWLGHRGWQPGRRRRRAWGCLLDALDARRRRSGRADRSCPTTRLVFRDRRRSGTEAQVDGLSSTTSAEGLRYTHEVNDRSGRLSATGYWATNHPDPAFDRDDDDGDGRWEEAEIDRRPGTRSRTGLHGRWSQLSRWHAKRERGDCEWAWDRPTRRGGDPLPALPRAAGRMAGRALHAHLRVAAPIARVEPRPADPDAASPRTAGSPGPGPARAA